MVVTPALFPLLLDSPKFERMGFGEDDLQRITAIQVAVGEVLEELGYAPGGSPATPLLLAHVDEVRSAFTANLRADDRPLPRSW